MKRRCKICDGPLVEAARQAIGRCQFCRPEINARWSGMWQWRSCVGTDDARESPIYRVTGPHSLAYDVERPGSVEASTCADPPRETRGEGQGLYIHGLPKFCGLDDALSEDAGP